MADTYKITAERVDKLELETAYFHLGGTHYTIKVEGKRASNETVQRALQKAAIAALDAWASHSPLGLDRPSKLELTIPNDK